MANSFGESGWIKLQRKEIHNVFYDSEPFDKWHAYQDLRMLADDEGTVRTSLETLKIRWFWGSRHKVRDFLGTLEDTGMGTVYTTPNKGTLIRLNMGFFDDKKPSAKKRKGTVKGTVKGNEEILLLTEEEEVRGSSSSDKRRKPSTENIKNNKSYEELMESLEDDDEYL